MDKAELGRRCQSGDVDYVKAALDEHGACEVFDNRLNGYSGCIHAATEKGKIPVLDFLIRNGEDINRKRYGGTEWTPLHCAVWQIDEEKRLRTVDFLLQKGAEVDVPDSDQMTPLFYAAEYGRTQTARLLLLAGADVEAKDKRGETPLRRAIRS